MRYFILFLICGCQSPLQAYVAEHTEAEITYGEDPRITVAAQNDADLNGPVMTELLWTQQHIAETILPDDDDLKNIIIFLPSTNDSFLKARKCIVGVSDSPSAAFIAPAVKIIVVSPKTWRERPLEYIVETYIHELMHYVALQLDGDMDADHSELIYWGKGGLIEQILNEWLTK